MFVTRIRAEGGVDDRSPWGDFWFEPVTVRTASGQRVSPDGAMRLSTVFRCVRVLAGTMASLPRCLYKPTADGRGRQDITDHWLWRLLRKPNRWQNGFEWHEMMVGHIALRGTGYNRIITDGRGGIAELQPLHPDRTQVEMLSNGVYRYRIKHQNAEDEVLPPSLVFKIAGFSGNGITGMNVIECARESIGEGLAQQGYSSRFFANDARPSGGWIEYPANFKDKTARDAFRESWQQAQAGANRGKTAVLESGMKYHELGMNNRDAQFLEAKNAKVPDICRWFDVPPHLAFALDRATDNNVEHLSLEFIKFTMTAWAERFEASIEDQLLGEADNAAGLELEYDMDNLARGDMVSRGEYYQQGINGGWLTRNEAREQEGLNPLEGLDEPLQPLNMTTPGDEPKPKDKTPAKRPPAPADDEDQARLSALELSVATRVVRKEVVTLRKAFARHDDSWAAFVHDFYVDHVDHVAASMLCAVETAAAWCERQRDELLRARRNEVLDLLEAWETTAAGELAARVQTSAQGGI